MQKRVFLSSRVNIHSHTSGRTPLPLGVGLNNTVCTDYVKEKKFEKANGALTVAHLKFDFKQKKRAYHYAIVSEMSIEDLANFIDGCKNVSSKAEFTVLIKKFEYLVKYK